MSIFYDFYIDTLSPRFLFSFQELNTSNQNSISLLLALLVKETMVDH